MDGSSGPTGAGTTIEFGGETLILEPLVYSDYGLIENHLLQQRSNPIDKAAEAVERLYERARARAATIKHEAEQRAASLPNEEASAVLAAAEAEADAANENAERLGRDMMDRAFDEGRKVNKVATQEVFEWLDTPQGLAFTLWLCLQKRYPGKFTLDRAGEIVLAMNQQAIAELLKRRDIASGTGILKNLTGRNSEKETPETTATNSGISESDQNEASAEPV